MNEITPEIVKKWPEFFIEHYKCIHCFAWVKHEDYCLVPEVIRLREELASAHEKIEALGGKI